MLDRSKERYKAEAEPEDDNVFSPREIFWLLKIIGAFEEALDPEAWKAKITELEKLKEEERQKWALINYESNRAYEAWKAAGYPKLGMRANN